MFSFKSKLSVTHRTVCEDNSRVVLAELVDTDGPIATGFNHVFSPAIQALVSIDPDISEELTAVVFEHLGEIIFNLLHGLVIRSDSGTDQTKRMWVTINQVDSALRDAFDDILGHIEPGWPTADDCEPEFFVRLDKILVLDIPRELRIVLPCREETRTRSCNSLAKARWVRGLSPFC